MLFLNKDISTYNKAKAKAKAKVRFQTKKNVCSTVVTIRRKYQDHTGER
jgi:hypothetical protein